MAINPNWLRLGARVWRILSAEAERERRAPAPPRPAPSATPHAPTRVLDTRQGLPPLSYDPHPDGDADPGEVCWTWVPYEDDPSRGKDRPVLVLARYNKKLLVAQLTSKDHTGAAREREDRWGRDWFDIGSGAWDRQGRESQVRLDRLLVVEPAAIRREGAALDPARFSEVVARLQELHGT